MEKNLGHATAYGYAKSKGYSGTEEEFAQLMADYASVGQSAAQSAGQAAASATSASGSAATASQAAQTATSKASEALTAAGTATTKASEASTSADTASAAALSASTSAQTATTAALTATTKASEAAVSANTATTAKTDAETARDAAAQSASEAAESARTLTIDATLTQSGQAADAKVVGDEIADLRSAFEEIIITEHTEQEIALTRTDNGAWRFLNNVYTFATNGAFASFTTKVFPAESLTHYKAHAAKYATCPPIVITDSNGNVLSAFGYDSEQGYSFTILDIEFDTPANSANIWLLYPYSAQADDFKLIKYTYSYSVDIPNEYKSLIRNILPETPYETVTGAVAWNASTLQLRNVGSYEGWTTKKYHVTEGEKIHVRGTYFNTNPFGAFVDNSNNLTPIWYDPDNTGYTVTANEKTITVPYGCVSVYLSYYSNWVSEAQAQMWRFSYGQKQKWWGRKWVCIGDSLTEYNAAAGMKYHDFVQCYTGIEPINLGKGGTGYKNPGSSETFYNRVNEIPDNFDIITIFGSGNDLSYTLGNPTDTGTDTICGCINKTITDIYSKFPLAKLGIITPCPWRSYPTTTENSMSRYADALVQICNLRGIPCLDLYRESGFRPWEDSFRTLAYTLNNSDGVHPNNTGNEILASHFIAFIDKLLL